MENISMASLSFIGSAKLVELVRNADPKGLMKVRVLTGHRLAMGADPLSPSLVLDLSKEMISPYSDSQETPAVAVGNVLEKRDTHTSTGRRSGSYAFELEGRTHQCKSLKEMLRMSLESLEQVAPGTLEQLSHIKPRSKRIVARDPKMLFETASLAGEYSEKLSNGWWMGTNNSAQETTSWLKRAVLCAGLRWGTDFSTDI
jgi:hypothetical protein